VYRLHRPLSTTHTGPGDPLAETLAALDELVHEGKVRYIGHSNLAAWQIADAAHLARELAVSPFISGQNHWSLLERDVEAEVVPAARHYGVGVLPYYPLANGLLTGKVRRDRPPQPGMRLHERPGFITDERLDKVEALAKWAESAGRSLLEVAIGALAAQPGCASVIAGATSPDQVLANAAAADWQPPPADLAAIDAIVPPPSTEI
jgi:aryl-alcohol dehydrogenase-like predicted oxidoreductase